MAKSGGLSVGEPLTSPGLIITHSSNPAEIGHMCAGVTMDDGSIFPPCDCADTVPNFHELRDRDAIRRRVNRQREYQAFDPALVRDGES